MSESAMAIVRGKRRFSGMRVHKRFAESVIRIVAPRPSLDNQKNVRSFQTSDSVRADSNHSFFASPARRLERIANRAKHRLCLDHLFSLCQSHRRYGNVLSRPSRRSALEARQDYNTNATLGATRSESVKGH